MNWQTWSPEEVSAWVKSIGPKYAELAQSFLESGVDGDFLGEITDDDLAELGLKTPFVRKRFNHKLKILKASSGADSGPPVMKAPPVTQAPPATKAPPVTQAPPIITESIPPPPINITNPPPVNPLASPPKMNSVSVKRKSGRVSALARQLGGQGEIKKTTTLDSPPAKPFQPPVQPSSSKKTLSKSQSDDPFADYSATNLADAIQKNTGPTTSKDPVKPPVHPVPPVGPGGPGMNHRVSMPPPLPPDIVAKRMSMAGPPAQPPISINPPAQPGNPPVQPGNPPLGPGGPGGLGLLGDLPPPPPRHSMQQTGANAHGLDDLPDLPDDLPPPGMAPGQGQPGMNSMGSMEPGMGSLEPGMKQFGAKISQGDTPGGPGFPVLAVQKFGTPDRQYLQLLRPGTIDAATVEFSTTLAICCASLQLKHTQLDCLNALATKLQGRQQVKIDLTNANLTRELTQHQEFLSVCYLIGYEIDDAENCLICQSPPSEEILSIFIDVVKEFDYSGEASYTTDAYAGAISTNEMEMLKLIIALTHEYTQQSEDAMETLVLFLPYLTTYQTFLKMLTNWFEWCDERSDTRLNRTGNVRYKLATILKYLLKEHKTDLEQSCGDELTGLLETIKEEDLIAYSHISAVIRDSNSMQFMAEEAIEGDSSEKINLLGLDPHMLADQLSMIDQKLFSHISTRELFDRDTGDTVLGEFVERFENIKRWIKLAVFCESSIDDRANRIRWVFKLAEKLLENRNLFSFSACLEAIDSEELQAFEPSWILVFKKKFRSKRDYAVMNEEWMGYRSPMGLSEAFWGLQEPGVPPYTVILKNVAIMDEFREISKNNIELYCHLRKINRLAKHVKSLQVVGYDFDANVQIQHALEAELRLQSRLKPMNISQLFLQALMTDGIPPPSHVTAPRPSMINM